jgi:hypothetical protein
MTPLPITEFDEYELRQEDYERRRIIADNRACGVELSDGSFVSVSCPRCKKNGDPNEIAGMVAIDSFGLVCFVCGWEMPLNNSYEPQEAQDEND